jgi:hypothetical protein
MFQKIVDYNYYNINQYNGVNKPKLNMIDLKNNKYTSDEHYLYFIYCYNLLMTNDSQKCEWCKKNYIYKSINKSIIDIINNNNPHFDIQKLIFCLQKTLTVSTYNKKVNKINKSLNHLYYFHFKFNKYISSNIYSYITNDILGYSMKYIINILCHSTIYLNSYYHKYNKTWRYPKIELYCKSCQYNNKTKEKCQFCGLFENLNVNGICRECWFTIFDKKTNKQ